MKADKKKDIESMYLFMLLVDKQFMETLMKTSKSSCQDEGEALSESSSATHADATDVVSPTPDSELQI